MSASTPPRPPFLPFAKEKIPTMYKMVYCWTAIQNGLQVRKLNDRSYEFIVPKDNNAGKMKKRKTRRTF